MNNIKEDQDGYPARAQWVIVSDLSNITPLAFWTKHGTFEQDCNKSLIFDSKDQAEARLAKIIEGLKVESVREENDDR